MCLRAATMLLPHTGALQTRISLMEEAPICGGTNMDSSRYRNATNFGMAFSASITGVVALLPSMGSTMCVLTFYSFTSPLPVVLLTKFDVAATGNNATTYNGKRTMKIPVRSLPYNVQWTALPGKCDQHSGHIENIPNTNYGRRQMPYSYHYVVSFTRSVRCWWRFLLWYQNRYVQEEIQQLQVFPSPLLHIYRSATCRPPGILAQ